MMRQIKEDNANDCQNGADQIRTGHLGGAEPYLVIGRYSHLKQVALAVEEEKRYRSLNWLQKLIYHITKPAD
ncbi:hypothetical protein [Thauera terpenica]|nr:hypothetical protein [Thauera terpenica]